MLLVVSHHQSPNRIHNIHCDYSSQPSSSNTIEHCQLTNSNMKSFISSLWTLSLLSSAYTTSAFAPHYGQQVVLRPLHAASSSTNEGDSSVNLPDRRQLFQSTVYTVAAASSSLLFPDLALASDKPIAVIGAGGKVGKLCTQILNKNSLYARAITRSGTEVLSESSSFVSYASGDVTKYDVIKASLKGCNAAIFAASASGKKKGGDPAHVDYLGLYNTAKACLELGIEKLVVVSAGSVTRPSFIGFKATNLFVAPLYGPNIMGYKMAGENAMRELYAGQDKCAYCIVRPGGLSDAPAVGPTKLHVSQGDIYSAEISREDVAEIAVAALLKGSATDNTTFELNNIRGLSKVIKELADAPADLVHEGANSYNALFDGLLSDKDMKNKYSQYLNDFNGGKVVPIAELA